MGTGPAGSVFRENLFYRETRVQDEGGLHVTKRSSDPRVAYPEVNVQVRDLERVVGIVAHFAPRGSVSDLFTRVEYYLSRVNKS